MSSAVGAYVGDLGSYDVNMGSYDVDMGRNNNRYVVYPGKDFLCTSAAISARRSARRKRSVGFFLPCIAGTQQEKKKTLAMLTTAHPKKEAPGPGPAPGPLSHNSES